MESESFESSRPQTGLKDGNKTVNVAIFASGAGSNALKIIEYFRGHPLIHIGLIVCNKPGAGVLQHAADNDIPVQMISKERFLDGDSYVPELLQASTRFIVLAGFLWKIPARILEVYGGHIINIHPALLPKFGGKGMYGSRVHEAVIAAGEKESGITIHYVDGHYDNGDTIFQETCAVLPHETPGTLAQKIHQLEHHFYPRVIEEVITKQVEKGISGVE